MARYIGPVDDTNFSIVLPGSAKGVRPSAMIDAEIADALRFFPHLHPYFDLNLSNPNELNPDTPQQQEVFLTSITIDFQPIVDINTMLKTLIQSFISLIIAYLT